MRFRKRFLQDLQGLEAYIVGLVFKVFGIAQGILTGKGYRFWGFAWRFLV